MSLAHTSKPKGGYKDEEEALHPHSYRYYGAGQQRLTHSGYNDLALNLLSILHYLRSPLYFII